MTGPAPRPLAARMHDIQPFHVMALLARARALEGEGRDIVHMEIGEPDFDSPAPVVEAGMRALRAGHTHYTPAAGLPALREAIASYYDDRFGVEVDPGRVLITPGASGALQLVLSVLVDPGREVLMSDPGYPCNRHFVRLVEGRAGLLPAGPETAYQLDPERLRAAWGPETVAALVASPANPTGTLLDRRALEGLSAVCGDGGGRLIVDEIYQGLSYGVEPITALSVSDELFVINSFSKYFGMTGWRLGWIVAPSEYVPELEKLAQNLFLSAPTAAQWAALAAFGEENLEILEGRRQAFEARRDLLLPALRELGFGIPVTPAGAFYLYADSSGLAADSFRLCEDLLEEAGVAATPGLDFGSHQPERHVRFAYTTAYERLEQGIERLAGFLKAR